MTTKNAPVERVSADPQGAPISMAPPSGEDVGDTRADGRGSTPRAEASTPSPDHGDPRRTLLDRVAEYRDLCPSLLREVAQSMGLTSPGKAPTDKLEALVAEVQRRLEEAQHQTLLGTAAREALLALARKVLADLTTDEGEVALQQAGITGTLDGATETQLHKLVTLGRGGVQ